MFCIHCGKEIENGTAFCSYCGGEQIVNSNSTANGNDVLSLFHLNFGSNNFHLATVFYLVSVCAAALSNIAAGSMPLPILEIFIIISLFKLNNLGKQNAPLLAFASPLKTLRVIVNIYMVVLWVLIGIFGVCGIILCASGSFIGVGVAEVFEKALSEYNFSLYAEELSELGGLIFAVLGIIFIIVAVVCALFNVFMYGSFYKTAKSTEWTAGTGRFLIEKVDSTYKWLVFMVVMSCISATFTLFSSGAVGILTTVSTGFSVAFLILVLGILKNFKKQ